MHAGPVPTSDDDDGQRCWVGRSSIRGHGALRMILVTSNLLGMQLVWSTEMGLAGPYLLSLGVSKSVMAMVFLAGPISGLLVQPIIGSLADNCQLSLGRRRPFIIGGGAICAVALLLFGWARQVAALFASPGGHVHSTLTIWLAVLSIYIIDFSVNAVQAADRALLVDVLPASEQGEVNAWAGRMTGIGSVAGFGIAEIDLTRYFGWLGGSQIQILSILVTLFFVLSHAVTCWAVTERVLLSNEGAKGKKTGVGAIVREIWTAYTRLPRPIWLLFQVQLYAWIGWFSIMFYSTTWVSEMFLQGRSLADNDSRLVDEAERIGSRAMFWHALVNLAAATFIPFLVNQEFSVAAEPAYRSRPEYTSTDSPLDRIKDALRPLLATLAPHLPTLPLEWLSLSLTWTFGNALFAVLLLSTFFAHNALGASFIIGITGLSWAITAWVPFSLLGELILQTESPAKRRDSAVNPDDLTEDSFVLEPVKPSTSPDIEEGKQQPRSRPRSPLYDDDGELERTPNVLQIRHSDSFDGEEGDEERARLTDIEAGERDTGIADSAGVILGMHNIFVVIPQMVVALLSTLIFAGLSPETSSAPVPVPAPPSATDLMRRQASEGTSGNWDSIGLMFRIGGVSALMATYMAWKLSREERDLRERKRSRRTLG